MMSGAESPSRTSAATGNDRVVDARDLRDIDAELRLLAAVRGSVTEQGGPQPSMGPVDKLLDEHCEIEQQVQP
jgi:hypothetical protein